jgi:hypothetical protein
LADCQIFPGSESDWQHLLSNYGYARDGFDPDVLEAFPAQELIYVSDLIAARWRKVTSSPGERFVALKNDKVWKIISSFGLPYPPFDSEDSTEIQDLGRSETEELGLIGPNDKPEPPSSFPAPEEIFSPPLVEPPPPRPNIGFRPGWQ